LGLLGAVPLAAVLLLDPAHAHLDSAVVLGGMGVLHQYSGLAGALGIAAGAALLAEWTRAERAVAGEGERRPFSRAAALRTALGGIEALGALSLTAYVSQSVLYLALFPPYTLDLGARLGSAGTAGIVLLGWLAMIPVATWLRCRGRRGPLEVLVRRLA